MGMGTTKNSVQILQKIKLLEVSLTLVRNADEVHLVAMFTSSAETAYTMNGNGVVKASIGRIYFKQWSSYIGEYCVYNDFWSESSAASKFLTEDFRTVVWKRYNHCEKVTPIAFEQALHLGRKREVRREQHAPRGFAARSRVLSPYVESLLAAYNAESLPGREILSSVILSIFDTLTIHVLLSSDTTVLISKF